MYRHREGQHACVTYDKEMTMSARPVPLHPTEVEYHGHTITLTHRPKYNDWQYTFTYTHTITIKNSAPRYDTALREAKKSIDKLERT